ncbi:MAG: hypothetical protein M5U34_28550 [Chloroflexi bacterium]|nr:hypothetical protein [Chloroflexota bacterium]
MSTGVIVLALLGSMMVGALLAVLVDTFYMRRWHEAVQSDKAQLEAQLRQRTIQLGRTQSEQVDLKEKLRAYQRELAEERAEADRLDDLRVALETKLETAVLDTESLKAEIKQFDDEIDDLRDEKVELARQLTVAHVEMKYLQEDLAENQEQLKVGSVKADHQKWRPSWRSSSLNGMSARQKLRNYLTSWPPSKNSRPISKKKKAN